MVFLKVKTLSGERLKRVAELGNIAGDLGASTATLALAWCIANPNVTTAILGATKEQQLEENLKALDVLPKLTPEVLQQIEQVMQTKPQFA
jgi:aryl-alcohol dehydrogenase-like predicted oxidoreductase